jgi:hypothetical protein
MDLLDWAQDNHASAEDAVLRVLPGTTVYEARVQTLAMWSDLIGVLRSAPEPAAEPRIPDVLFDGYGVLSAMTPDERQWAGPEAVGCVLDTVVRMMRSAITKEVLRPRFCRCGIIAAPPGAKCDRCEYEQPMNGRDGE